MRVSGSIMLRITILPNGHVAEVQFEKGHPLLLRAAEDAVRHWRYAAATETTTQTVQVNFDLPH
jgi:TonB family protein